MLGTVSFVLVLVAFAMALYANRLNRRRAAGLRRHLDDMIEREIASAKEFELFRVAAREDASKLFHAQSNVEVLTKRLDEETCRAENYCGQLSETRGRVHSLENLLGPAEETAAKLSKAREELAIAEFWRQKLLKMITGLEQVEGPANAEKRFKLVELKPVKAAKKSSSKVS